MCHVIRRAERAGCMLAVRNIVLGASCEVQEAPNAQVLRTANLRVQERQTLVANRA